MTRPAKSPRIGRPPLPDAERKGYRLLVTMTPAERAALEAWAGERALGPLLVETGLRSARRSP